MMCNVFASRLARSVSKDGNPANEIQIMWSGSVCWHCSGILFNNTSLVAR